MKIKNFTNKWDKIYEKKQCSDTIVCPALANNTHLLPNKGKALDLASGLGGNAILLARLGLDVEAWDISNTALKKLYDHAKSEKLNIKTVHRDSEQYPPEKNTFDVIAVSYFLHRPTFQDLLCALKKEGLLFYQTFIKEKTSEVGPTNPKYLLETNELLNLCQGMEILVYREEGKQGDIQKGLRNQALIVAKKI